MKPTRKIRIFAALIALLGVLHMQFALAAYACPGIALGQAATIDAGMEMPGCAHSDANQPALCHAHDRADKQSFDKPQLPALQPLLAAATLHVVTNIDAPASAIEALTQVSLLHRATAPPLSIRNCCFRI